MSFEALALEASNEGLTAELLEGCGQPGHSEISLDQALSSPLVTEAKQGKDVDVAELVVPEVPIAGAGVGGPLTRGRLLAPGDEVVERAVEDPRVPVIVRVVPVAVR